MLIFKINNYFGMDFFCNNANSDKSVFLPIHSKREKKSIFCAKMFHFIDSQWGFVIRISKKTSLTSLDVNSFSFDRRRE